MNRRKELFKKTSVYIIKYKVLQSKQHCFRKRFQNHRCCHRRDNLHEKQKQKTNSAMFTPRTFNRDLKAFTTHGNDCVKDERQVLYQH